MTNYEESLLRAMKNLLGRIPGEPPEAYTKPKNFMRRQRCNGKWPWNALFIDCRPKDEKTVDNVE